jgi:rare lipoprotein A
MGADAGLRRLIAVAAIGLWLAGCGSSSGPHGPVADVSGHGKSRGYYRVGSPYQVNGVWYYPKVDYDYDATGLASWYGEAFQGRATANGEVFDLNRVTAAHKTLQLPSIVEVTNLHNGRALKVRVNDRGPFAGDRIIDLSRRAAQLLGFETGGTAPVRVRIMKEESIRVAEAAMRGDIGGTRLAEAARQTRPGTLADARPVVRPAPAASPSTRLVVAAAPIVHSAPEAPLPGRKPILAAVEPALPSRVVTAPPQTAEPHQPPPAQPAQSSEYAARPRVWPSLISAAHAATEPAAVAARRQLPAGRGPGRTFIQAGAFAVAGNADRVRARVEHLARTEVLRATLNGSALYRVRLGPLASEEAARRLLNRVVESGFPEARIVVE